MYFLQQIGEMLSKQNIKNKLHDVVLHLLLISAQCGLYTFLGVSYDECTVLKLRNFKETQQKTVLRLANITEPHRTFPESR